MRALHSSLTLVVLIFFLSGLHGQMIVGLDKDSLRKALDKMPPDSTKVSTFIRLGQQYEDNAPDSAISFYRQAKTLSERLNYPAGIVQYINNYTAVLNVQGHFDSSILLNLQAVDLCRKYGLQALYVKALINTGAAYQYKEEYLPAADYYLKALPFLEVSDDPQLAVAYYNICGLYRSLNQPKKAEIYGRRALQLARRDGNEHNLANASINMGNVLNDLGKMNEGIRYIDTAYQLGRRLDDANIEENALINLGDTYLKMHAPGKSLPAYRQALIFAQALKDPDSEAFALQGIALCLYWEKQYGEAETQLQKAILFSRQNDQKEVLSNALFTMADVQIALGKPQNAQLYRDQYDSIHNQLFSASLAKNVQELETKYKVEKQQHELLQKTVELEAKKRESLRRRNWLIIAGASLLLLSLLLLLIHRFYRQRQQLHREALQSLQAQQENLRLKALVEGQLRERRRIGQEMHDDMGSGLTSLLFLSRTLSQPEETAEKIRHLSATLIQKMNEIVWTMEHEHDTLESLIAYMRVNVAQLLENAGIAYDFRLDENIPERSVSQQFRRNIYLVVKEAVHNVIRHAGATSVTITITITQQLEIIVQDNGKGFDPGSGRRFGNGTKNMMQRMAQVGGSLDIIRQEGTRVRLTAPLEAL